MEVFYCPNCKEWKEWYSEISDVTPPSGVGAIEPNDQVFMCDCGFKFSDDIAEDNCIDVITLLNDKKVTI